MATIRILSIDGGGIRGIIAARVLREIVGDRPVSEIFHLVAGTSIGGIIASGLATDPPFAPLEAFALLVERGGEVFGDRRLWGLPGSNLFDEKYSASPLERVLAAIFGERRLSDVSGVDLLVPGYAIELPRPGPRGETRSPMFFRNWRARGEELPDGATRDEYDFLLRDVGRATSAAPTYFEPAAIESVAGERYGMIDGGVFANNPAMCALVDSYRRYGREHEYLVVSLGNGFQQRDIPLREARGWGLIGWSRPLINVLMDGSSDTVAYQCGRLHPDGHFRFDIPLGRTRRDRFAVSDDLDDASPGNVDALISKAETLVRDEAPNLARLRERLAGPKARFPG